MHFLDRKFCGDIDRAIGLNTGNKIVRIGSEETRQALDTQERAARGLGLPCLLLLLSFGATQSAFSASVATARIAYGGTVIESAINPTTPSNSDTMAGDQKITKADLATNATSDFATVGLADMSISGFASSKAGTLKASLSGSLNVKSANTGTFRVSTGFLQVAFAEAGWLDVAVVEGLQAGRKITFNAVLMLDGGLEAAVDRGNPSADTVFSRADVGLLGTGINAISGIAREQIGPEQHLRLPVPSSIPVHTTMVVGELQQIGYTLRAGGSLGAIASGAAIPGTNTVSFGSDFSHTLRWGGVTSITDIETGEVLSGWTIRSDSGFDYSMPAPVPLPATLPLLLTSLAGLIRMRRGQGLGVTKG